MDLKDAVHAKKFGLIHKPTSYFSEYDFCFEQFKEKPIRVLEIGVEQGGSLAVWKEYFPLAHIVGIDIDESCRRFESDRIHVHIGDQADAAFLARVSKLEGPFDIVIDDGGHTMRQQIVSFEALFPLLNDKGVYVIEDLHTSYWPEFFDQRERTIDYLKKRIDDLNYWAALYPRARKFRWLRAKLSGLKARLGRETKWVTPQPRTYLQRWIRSMYFADSIVFIFREEVERNVAPRL
jgi:hypothetical protein